MSATVQHVTATDFEREVLQAATPVVVDFWAPWCGPCRMVAPELEKAAEQMAGTAKIVKVNVDEQPAVASRYGVMSIPTLIVFQQGKEIGRHVGFITADALATTIAKSLGQA